MPFALPYHVRQFWETSGDRGTTWVVAFDGHYSGRLERFQRPLASTQPSLKVRMALSTSRPSASYITTSRAGLAPSTITADRSEPRDT